jgi:hypothetical protein
MRHSVPQKKKDNNMLICGNLYPEDGSDRPQHIRGLFVLSVTFVQLLGENIAN